jgi:hypothetical protein
MQHTWERYEMHTKFCLEIWKERDHFEDAGIIGRIMLITDLDKTGS